MRFGVLGQIQVGTDGSDGPHGSHLGVACVEVVTAAMDRLLLAELLVHANQLVSTEHLVDALWGHTDTEPARPANAVQVRVSRLRTMLRRVTGPYDPPVDALLATRPGGYLLDVRAATVDAFEFVDLVHRSRKSAQADRLTALARAERLWRGPAFGDIRGSLCVIGESLRLEEMRVAAREERFAAQLALGMHHEAVPELVAAVEAYPLRERPRVQLMLALHRSGRTAEALQLFADTRAMLGDSLGLDPGSELRRMHEAILADAPELRLAPAAAAEPDSPTVPIVVRAPGGPAAGGPPPAVATFTGRAAELDALQRELTAPPAGTARVAAVYGPGGTGKSALAVQAAHRVASGFPDGLVHLDLRGFAAGRDPVEPYDALTRLLGALGETTVPETLAGARDRYRTVTASRRALLILDDAADADQLTPLIPAGADSAVLVTSRRSLAALDGAVHIRLGGLDRGDAVSLLSRLVGPARAVAEAGAVTYLAELCDDLPLALCLAGTRLATRPDWPVAALAERLADERRRLEELRVGDVSVRDSIERSCRDLLSGRAENGPAAVRALRLITNLPLRDITVNALVVLLSLPEDEIRRLLEWLADTQLLESPAPDHYHMQDLTRLTVRALLDDEDSNLDQDQ